MGTRSVTYVRDNNGDKMFSIYRQFDGYPSGHGQDVIDILGPRKLVNGYDNAATQTNGISCAAALLVSALKGGAAGNIYMHGPNYEIAWEEYVYELFEKDDALHLSMWHADNYGEDIEPVYTNPVSTWSVKDAERAEEGEEEI